MKKIKNQVRIGRLGAPTNLRPAGAHKNPKHKSRAQQRIELRKEISA
jgi:hypothetical protein